MRAPLVVLAGTLLPGCGLLLGSPAIGTAPAHLQRPETAYQIEGEVRDELTLAPIADAEVVLETSRAGYRVARRADAGGRFAIGYSAVARRSSNAERNVDRILFGVDDPEVGIASEITIRARGGGRCSRVQRLQGGRDERALLLVGDCARNDPKPDPDPG